MNASKCRLLLGPAVLLIATLAAPADSFGAERDCNLRIAGSVTRSSDRGPIPQPRVQVHLVNNRGDKRLTVSTDRDGFYVFQNLCPGTYTVYPGPVLVEDTEDPPLPSLYTPAFARVTVPGPPITKGFRPQARFNFVRNEPPPPRNVGDFYHNR
jgi:carboxypeptidase family protein